ncbi:MAG: amidohydrolase family protein [bacterium]
MTTNFASSVSLISNNPFERLPIPLRNKLENNPGAILFDPHCHFFNNDYVPDKYFGLRIPVIHNNKILTWLSKWLHIINPFNDNDKLDHYGYFISMIKNNSMRQIADYFIKIHPVNSVFCPLMMDLEHGIGGNPVKSLDEQMDEMKAIRDDYPATILPFMAVNPLNKRMKELFIKAFSDEYRFFGVKLYPSLGFMPSHPDLMEIYAVCEKKNIPVTVHCGGEAVATTSKELNLKYMVLDANGNLTEVEKFIKISKKKERAAFFNNPSNYEPVLRTFPKLRINFAHFGGNRGWADYLKNKDNNRVTRIIDYMMRYPNVYADISYMFHEQKVLIALKELLAKNSLVYDRTLYGSDFYMITIEGRFKYLRANLYLTLGNEVYRKIAGENVRNFLF